MSFINLAKGDIVKISSRIDLPMSLIDNGGLKISDFIGDKSQMYQFEYVRSKEAYLIKRLSMANDILKGIDGVLKVEFFNDGVSNTVYIGNENGADNEYWIPIFLSNGYVLIANLQRPDMVLTVLNYDDVNISMHSVELRPSEDVSDLIKNSIVQQFKITEVDLFKMNDSDRLEDENYNFLIRASYNNNLVYTLGNDGFLYAQEQQNIGAERWKFTYNVEKKAYQITTPSVSGEALTYKTDDSGVHMWTNTHKITQYWILEQATNDKYIIKPKYNSGKALFSNKTLYPSDLNKREEKQRLVLQVLK